MRFRKKILIFVLSISVFVSSFSVPLTVYASDAASTYSLYELLIYVISALAAGGTTIGINATIEDDEDFFQLCNDYLSFSSGISINNGLVTFEKVDTTKTLDEWMDELEVDYGSVFADQGGGDFLDKLKDIELRLAYWDPDNRYPPVDSDGKKYLLTLEDQEKLGTDKLWLTEEEFQELLYALYLKTCGVLDNSNEETAPTPDSNGDKPKLDYKSLAVSAAGVSSIFLTAGAVTIWDNIGDFFDVLLNDETTYDTYTTLEKLRDLDMIKYTGNFESDANGVNIVNCVGSYTYISEQTVEAYFTSSYRPFVIVDDDITTLAAFVCYNADKYPNGYPIKWNGTRTYNGRKYSIDSYSLGVLGASDAVWSLNCPMFLDSDVVGIQTYVATGDDSSCINKESPSLDIDDVSNNALNLGATFAALKNLPVEKGLSSASLMDYVQNLLDEQNILQSEPDNYNTLLAPKIEDLVNSATDVQYVYIVDDDSSVEENTNVQYGNDSSTDSEYEVITEPELMPLPAILPFSIPSVAQKVTGPEDWEYNYSPYFIAILSVLFIDFPTIKTHTMESLQKIPTFNDTQIFFDSIGVVADAIDDDIVYPVISMETPDILRPFYPNSEIIIYDCSEHAKYYSFVRSIMSVAISIGFIMWLLRQIKISFSID